MRETPQNTANQVREAGVEPARGFCPQGLLRLRTHTAKQAETLWDVPADVTTDLSGEKWKPVYGHGGRYYEASNAGRIRRGGKVLKPSTDTRGYLILHICVDGDDRCRQVHRLVAEAFLGPRPDGMTVNHINGIKVDNRVENLEYLTRADNIRHAVAMGLKRCGGGKPRMSAADVLEVRRLADISTKELSRKYRVCQNTILNIRNGTSWKRLISPDSN